MSTFDFASEFESFGDDLKGTAYEGDFVMVVRKAEPGTTAKGKQKFQLTLEFVGGPHHGKTVPQQLVWSPENDTAAKIFASSLRVLGAPQEWIMANRPSPEQIAQQITGTKFNARCKAGEFNGQPQTNVSFRSTVSVESPVAGTAKSEAASAAVSLDDEPAAAPAPSAAEVKAATADPDNPWAA